MNDTNEKLKEVQVEEDAKKVEFEEVKVTKKLQERILTLTEV